MFYTVIRNNFNIIDEFYSIEDAEKAIENYKLNKQFSIAIDEENIQDYFVILDEEYNIIY